jgi:hypothetical protein
MPTLVQSTSVKCLPIWQVRDERSKFGALPPRSSDNVVDNNADVSAALPHLIDEPPEPLVLDDQQSFRPLLDWVNVRFAVNLSPQVRPLRLPPLLLPFF